MVEVINIFRI